MPLGHAFGTGAFNMVVQSLNGIWELIRHSEDGLCMSAAVPGSVYSALLNEGLIPDPYAGENQYEAERISEYDYSFVTSFSADAEIKASEKIYLRFEGIDTAAEVIFNGISLGKCANMHRIYEFDVTELISVKNQKIEVRFVSPIRYITDKNSDRPLWGVASTMAGYPHIRKAHYMFGWDWGPILPDMGIWRSVKLIGVNGGRIESLNNHQKTTGNGVALTVEGHLSDVSSDKLSASVTVTAPGGDKITKEMTVSGNNLSVELLIADPKLWYPRGYGDHPLYEVDVTLKKDGETVDEKKMNIGLRTITVSRVPDNDGTDGEEFAFVVNGIKIFAMGANYIPEDQILGRMCREKTEKLLNDCIAANYNMIRVWGGGVYPEEYLYDFCDRNGILVWQDFMFACAVYSADRDFCENIKKEAIDNVKRFRNHACLAMWCGNKEIESAWQYWGLPDDLELKKGYLRMFEVLIPKVVSYYDPDTFYWPSSPSSGGSFVDSGAKNKGDIHFWEVWHSCKPISDYEKYLFRFCSEFGFESIPCLKTVRSFADESDLSLTSPVMEAHQKCEAGNEKLMYYIAQTTHYPYTFKGLIYASQLVQAEAIRICVEHMRRNRGTCMGSLYWQVNDSNPVISWSSIDYFGRWKALHYYAKRFYAPVLLSADISDSDKIVFNVSNERMKPVQGIISWRVRKNTGGIITEGEIEVTAEPLSAVNAAVLMKDEVLPVDGTANSEYLRNCYLEYSLTEKSARLSSGTTLFVPYKSFNFVDPKLRLTVDDLGSKYKINVAAEGFAKGVRIDSDRFDLVLSDNWFDLHSGSSFVFVSKSDFPPDFTAENVRLELNVTSYYNELELNKFKKANANEVKNENSAGN